MKDLEAFRVIRPVVRARLRNAAAAACRGGSRQAGGASASEDVGRAHAAQIADQSVEACVATRRGRRRPPAWRSRPRSAERRSAEGSIRGWTWATRRPSLGRRRASPRAASAGCRRRRQAPMNSASARSARPDREQRARQVVDGVERADRDAQVVSAAAVRPVFIDMSPPAAAANSVRDRRSRPLEQRPSGPPCRVGAADQQRRSKLALDERRAGRGNPRTRARAGTAPVRCGRRGRGAARRLAVEQVGRHGGACAAAASGDKEEWVSVGSFGRRLRQVLDFALPPRCAGCGAIVDEVHGFCPDCWTQIEFLGDERLPTCGLPLEATDAELCGVCLAKPPRIERTRAAVAYDESVAEHRAPAQIWPQGRAGARRWRATWRR